MWSLKLFKDVPVEIGLFKNRDGFMQAIGELRLAKDGLSTLNCAEDSELVFEPHKRKVVVASTSIKELGFTKGTQLYQAFTALTLKKGCSVCAPELAVALLQQHGRRFSKGQYVNLYMWPVNSVHKGNSIFQVGRNDDGKLEFSVIFAHSPRLVSHDTLFLYDTGKGDTVVEPLVETVSQL